MEAAAAREGGTGMAARPIDGKAAATLRAQLAPEIAAFAVSTGVASGLKAIIIGGRRPPARALAGTQPWAAS